MAEDRMGHVAITGVEALSVLPVIGMIGKADEVWALCKRADDHFVLKRLTDFEIADKIAQAGTLDAKYLSNTAEAALKQVDAGTYREILESCETVSEYKRLYGGSYNNEVIEDLVKRINNGELDGEISAELVEEVLSGVRKGDFDAIQEKFNKLLNSDYYKTDLGYDCSEIAQDFYDAAGQKGIIYRIEGKNGFLNGYEYDDIVKFDYHEVYSDGKYIYDPRYKNMPILKDDYFRALDEINSDGFDVYTKQ